MLRLVSTPRIITRRIVFSLPPTMPRGSRAGKARYAFCETKTMAARYDRFMEKTSESALVLFSGGQDSAVCLAWALERFDRVETIGFDYGQRHRGELDCRDKIRAGIKKLDSRWAARLSDDHMLSLDSLGRISDTALTREVE